MKVTGAVNTIAAGTAANNYAYDFNTATIADGGDTLAVGAPATGAKGISIKQTTVGDLNSMQAGSGGPGGAGGALSTITILADQDGFTLGAGNGGAGGPGKATGGAGGAVTSVIVNGLGAGDVDTSANSVIEIKAGDAGDAAAGSKGGKGGKAENVFVGFKR